MIVQWEGDKKTLILLREIFREDMKENNYCIGEERVEDLFHSLLGEFNPKSARELLETASNHPNTKQVILDEIEALIPKIHEIFNKNHSFYKRLK